MRLENNRKAASRGHFSMGGKARPAGRWGKFRPAGLSASHFYTEVTQAATNYRVRACESSYDGATLTNTSKLDYGSGSITNGVPVVNGGNLAIAIGNASGGDLTNARLQVRFVGAFVI
jgi:hypothetical protein